VEVEHVLAHGRRGPVHQVTEQLDEVLPGAPAGGRGEAGRRRRVPGDDPEQLAGHAVGRPAGKADGAAWAYDPGELGRGLPLVRREHHADGAQCDVERARRERQVLGVTLDELDVEVLGRRARPALLQQVGRVVDARRVGEPQRGRDRGVALPAGHVENPLSGVHVDVLDEAFGDDLQGVADAGVVAGLPTDALLLLDRVQVDGGFHTRAPSLVSYRCQQRAAGGGTATAGTGTQPVT
jgi:hypothetical protein